MISTGEHELPVAIRRRSRAGENWGGPAARGNLITAVVQEMIAVDSYIVNVLNSVSIRLNQFAFEESGARWGEFLFPHTLAQCGWRTGIRVIEDLLRFPF
jgi:hypothetical protein